MREMLWNDVIIFGGIFLLGIVGAFKLICRLDRKNYKDFHTLMVIHCLIVFMAYCFFGLIVIGVAIVITLFR